MLAGQPVCTGLPPASLRRTQEFSLVPRGPAPNPGLHKDVGNIYKGNSCPSSSFPCRHCVSPSLLPPLPLGSSVLLRGWQWRRAQPRGGSWAMGAQQCNVSPHYGICKLWRAQCAPCRPPPPLHEPAQGLERGMGLNLWTHTSFLECLCMCVCVCAHTQVCVVSLCVYPCVCSKSLCVPVCMF